MAASVAAGRAHRGRAEQIRGGSALETRRRAGRARSVPVRQWTRADTRRARKPGSRLREGQRREEERQLPSVPPRDGDADIGERRRPALRPADARTREVEHHRDLHPRQHPQAHRSPPVDPPGQTEGGDFPQWR